MSCHPPFLRSFLLCCLLVLCSLPLQAQVTVRDIAIEARIQDDFGGHFKRGRALVAADFDQDGRVDFYIGNPGDESLIYRNVEKAGRTQFVMHQILLKGVIAWGATAADYDNDGDLDLYISCGANEGTCLDYLFKNMLAETGVLTFVDVTSVAGIAGPVPEGGTEPIPVASANGDWGDYDQDGDLDLFVSVNIWAGEVMDMPFQDDRLTRQARTTPENENLLGRNVLWQNNGDGTFTDVTDAHGLGITRRHTRHSTFVDIDNDGDLDLFESNNGDFNVFWRNQLIESGTPIFLDVTTPMSPPGENLNYPVSSFASCAADFDNDGWEDIISFMNNPNLDTGTPYEVGHALFMNDHGTYFRNVASSAEINNPYIGVRGVMGCQIGDLDADGTPDIYIGNGGPPGGQLNQLYLSDTPVGTAPHYTNRTDLIDFPSPVNPHTDATYPSYPYRTHGTAMVDIDGDGLLELYVINGGPSYFEDDAVMQEPNRLFKFENWESDPSFFKVRLAGDGVNINRDAIGARVQVQVRHATQGTWNLYQTMRGGSCFSAQNGFELFFGINKATFVDRVTITWPDGTRTIQTTGLTPNTTAEFTYGVGLTKVIQPRVVPAASPALDAALAEAETPAAFVLDAAYPNPFNPSTRLRFTLPEAADVRLTVFDALGRDVAVVAEGFHAAGSHTVRFDGTGLPSGMYLYRLDAGAFSETRTMMLLK